MNNHLAGSGALNRDEGHAANAWHTCAEHLASFHVPFVAAHSKAMKKHTRKSFSKVKSKAKSKIELKTRADYEARPMVDDVAYAIEKHICLSIDGYHRHHHIFRLHERNRNMKQYV